MSNTVQVCNKYNITWHFQYPPWYLASVPYLPSAFGLGQILGTSAKYQGGYWKHQVILSMYLSSRTCGSWSGELPRIIRTQYEPRASKGTRLYPQYKSIIHLYCVTLTDQNIMDPILQSHLKCFTLSKLNKTSVEIRALHYMYAILSCISSLDKYNVQTYNFAGVPLSLVLL